MFKKREFLLFLRDRLAAVLLGLFFIGVMVLVGMTAFNVRVSDVQVPIRYSDYGFTNLYRDRWYALMSFGLFGLIVFVTNGFLAVKLHGVHRGLALGVLGFSILIVLIAVIVASAVFRLAAFSL